MSTDDRIKRIREYLDGYYVPQEFPALLAQCDAWADTRPLEGLRILDATPVFRNTLAKYLALLHAGAMLDISMAPGVMIDPSIRNILWEFGFDFIDNPAGHEPYDIIMDCAGIHAGLEPRLGFVELTRSGYDKYVSSPRPVYLADEGIIKAIETTLGTGDGFLRGLQHFGHVDLKGEKMVIFGYGKVGRGIAMYCLREGAELYIVDEAKMESALPEGMTFVDKTDRGKIEKLAGTAFCLVSATGKKDALAGICSLRTLLDSPAIIANMGVEDEWGGLVPPERVLNGKTTLNFALEEPTRMRYIEGTMALDNYGAIELTKRHLPPGISVPGGKLENIILNIIREKGMINDELKMAGL